MNTSSTIKRWQENEEFKIWDRSPLGLSGLILNIIKDLYKNNNSQFKYSDNPIESKILIDLHQQWNPVNCENYPGIYVRRNDWMMEPRVIGNYNKLMEEKDGYSYDFWAPISTTYSIICLGKEYGEIETLLNETFQMLVAFSDPIMRYFKFHKFDIAKISPVSIIKEEKNYRTGSIDIYLMFDYTWKITLEKSVIKGLIQK